MTVREAVVVSPAIRDHLGQSVDQVLASLWAVDCQTCNEPLAGQQTALSVDDMITFATASLHHTRCRPSAWNDDNMIPVNRGATLTHRSVCLLAEVVVGDDPEPEYKPFVLINTGLEMVYLERGPLGQWQVVQNGVFVDAGFKPPPITIDEPVPGTVAQMRGDHLSVVFDSGLVGPYSISLITRARSLIKSEGGVTVAITSAVDPHEPEFDLGAVMSGDRTLMGFVQLQDHR